jgi:hypothetical protein
MSDNDGPKDQQIAMVRLATNLFKGGAARLYLFGRLVEEKIYLLRRADGDRFRPWIPFARVLLECDDEGTHRCLMHAIFCDRALLRDPDIADLADRLYKLDLSESETRTIVNKIMQFLADDFPLWREHFVRARSMHCDAADLEAFKALSRWRYQRELAETLVSFWRDVLQPAPSRPAAKVLGLLDQGETIDAVFAQAWWKLVE